MENPTATAHQEAAVPGRPARRYLPDTLTVENWASLAPHFEELLSRNIASTVELEQWISDLSEMEAFLSEETGWRYIRMSCDTADESRAAAFRFIMAEIEPKSAPYADKFNAKLLNSPYLSGIDQQKHFTYLRSVRMQLKLFREENIPLFTEMSALQQQYGAISGSLSITHEGKEMTIQQAMNLLKEPDRSLREDVFRKISDSRQSKAEEVDALFTKLVGLRHKAAQNAGYPDFRAYKSDALGRFDYGVQECLEFHRAIEAECRAITDRLDTERKELMGLADLRPWDLDTDPFGSEPLRPFTDDNDLLDKSIECFTRLRPFYGDCLRTMQEMGHLDLGSRLGKAPGGFNYPLYETGVPFIFMNAAGTVRDMVTMIHEGGHAVHSFLSRDLEITAFKSLTSEIAELASMGMELMSMDHWDVFFPNPDHLRRAKKEHLAKVLNILPWVATVDSFQHWVYTHPQHSVEERDAEWTRIHSTYGSTVVDWQGLEDTRAKAWHRQMHLFEVPFYYIEYAIAQLGAIALWRNYRQDPTAALDAYEAALSLGYSKPIGEVYAAAGIRFDFSQAYVRELMQFVWDEYQNL